MQVQPDQRLQRSVTVVTVLAKHGPRQPRPLLKLASGVLPQNPPSTELVLEQREANVFPKNCPSCGHRFTMRRYLGLRSQRFTCPGCRAPLAVNIRYSWIAAFVQAPVLALPISFAVKDPVYWWLLLPAAAVCLPIHYAFFAVEADSRIAGGRAGEAK